MKFSCLLVLFFGFAFIILLPLKGLAQNDDSRAERLMKKLDKNSDGKLSSDEFTRKNVFKWFDLNYDGFVTLEEIKKLQRHRQKTQNSEDIILKKNDIAYGKNNEQKLDLYLPNKPRNAPVMIYVHGGGWKKGDKSRVGSKPEFFLKKGWIFLSVNYRLLPDGKHPANADDVAAAVAWVHNNIKKYGGNPDEIFIMGHSAGCHLVSLVATSEKHLKKSGKTLDIIKGVIALDTNSYDVYQNVNVEKTRFHSEIFGDDPELNKDMSPQRHIQKGKKIPPFFIVYTRGSGKNINPKSRIKAEKFADSLKKAGFKAEIIDATDRSHGEVNQRFGSPDDEKVTLKAWSFIENIRKQN